MEMNKELQRFAKAIKRLEVGYNAIYFDPFNPTNAQAFIKSEAFDNWFDEYEVEPHGAGHFYTKYAYYDKIKFYALYEPEELSREDNQRLREQAYEAIEKI